MVMGLSVRELIEELEKQDPDAHAWISIGNETGVAQAVNRERLDKDNDCSPIVVVIR